MTPEHKTDGKDQQIQHLSPKLQIAMPVSPVRRLIAGLILMSIAIGLLGLFQLDHTRTQSLQQAEKNSKALADILQQTIGEMFQRTDMVILHILDEIVHQSATGGVQRVSLGLFIERQFKMIPELDSLRICDAQGMVTIGSGHLPTVPVSISDRDYFIYLRDHADSGMIISKPIIGKISKKPVITCARRITMADGSFGGLVYAVLPLQQFNDLFKNVPVGPHGSISLRRDDLSIITRYSAVEEGNIEQQNATAAASETWRRLIEKGELKSGTYATVSKTDAIRRIHSYNRINNYPLYVNVGLSKVLTVV